MNSRNTSPVRRHHGAGVGIAEQPFDGHVLCERCTTAGSHRGGSDGDGHVSVAALDLRKNVAPSCHVGAQGGRDQIVNTCGKTVSINLHSRRKLRGHNRSRCQSL